MSGFDRNYYISSPFHLLIFHGIVVVELRAVDTCPFQKSIWGPFSGLFATPDPNVKVAPKVAQRERSTHQVPEDGEEDAAGGDVRGDLGGEARPDDHDEGEDAGVEEV